MKDLGMDLENPEIEQSSHDVDAEKLSDFNFETWTKDNSLTRKTAGILRKEELVTQETLLLLEEKDLCELEIPMGQRKLLINAVARLGGAIPKQKGQETSDCNIRDIRQQAAQIESSGKAFEAFMNNLVTSNEVSKASEGPIKQHQSQFNSLGNQMDPRTILTIRASSRKTVHITQFLTEKTKKRLQSRKRDFVLSNTGPTGSLVIKTEDEHPYAGFSLD